MERVLGDVLRERAEDGLRPTSILDFRPRFENRCKVFPETPSSVHRFLISRPDLRIDARFSPETAQRLHRFLISGPDLRIAAAENSFACSDRSGNALPHPILIFVAAKKNGSACNGRGGYEVRVRF